MMMFNMTSLISRLKKFIKKILNKRIFFIIFLIAIVACFDREKSISAAVTSGPLDLSTVVAAEQLGKAFIAIASHVKPAVVSVFSEKKIKLQQWGIPFPFSDELLRQFFGGRLPRQKSPGLPREYTIPQMGMGSGMILDNNGNILTNYHVVQNVDEIKVQFADQKKYKAKIIGTDAKTDVAIIRIEEKNIAEYLNAYKTVSFGDSDAIQVGEVVLAIGAPFGLAQTVTHGIISAVGRADVGVADYEDFLQTDAPINPGNSGGPLVNIHGEVIGMNSAIATSVGQSGGVGFAIPSNMIKSMLPKIIKGETITRGELGVSIQNLTNELAQYFGLNKTSGVLISHVYENSAADKAGLKIEDIIVKYDGKPVDDAGALRNLVAGSTPGTKIKIEYLRNGKKQSTTVTIGAQKNETKNEQFGVEKNGTSSEQYLEQPLEQLGLSIETLNKEMALMYNIKEKNGVMITDIEYGSPADIANLRVGDVISQINRKPIKSTDDVVKILAQSKSDTILMLVKRQELSLFISLKKN